MLINDNLKIQMTKSDGVQDLVIRIKEIQEKVSHFRPMVTNRFLFRYFFFNLSHSKYPY